MKINFNYIFLPVIILLLPIMMANSYYIDDNFRSISGEALWSIDGRPLSNLLMYIINAGTHLSDLAPLPTILSALMLSLAMYCFTLKISPYDKRFVLVALGVFANPFILENSAYRFDIVPMYASLAVSYCFILKEFKNKIFDILVKSIVVCCVLSLYQASINFTLCLILFQMVWMYVNDRSTKFIIHFIVRSILSIGIGMTLYLKAILPYFLVQPGSSDHPNLAVDGIINLAKNNFIFYVRAINESMPDTWRLIYFLIFSLSVLAAIFIFIKHSLLKKKSVFIGLIVGFSPLIAVMLSVSSLLFLNETLSSPRVMIGFSGTCLLVCYFVYLLSNELNSRLAVILALPIFFVTIMSYAYGNALRENSKLTDSIFNDLKNDVYNLTGNVSPNLIFDGETPLSKVYINSLKSYPLLGKLVPNYFNNWTLPYTYMLRNGIYIKKDYSVDPQILITQPDFCSDVKISHRYHYNLIFTKNVVTVDFSKKLCQ